MNGKIIDIVKDAKVRQFRNGPEQILPADNYMSYIIDKPVKLRMEKTGNAKPLSVPGLLKRTAENYPMVNALASKNSSNQWEYVTYKQYLQDVRNVAKGFINLGLERFHGVCIIGFNSKEWVYSFLGAIFAGGLGAGIYTTNSPEACAHCAKDCKAQIFVVEDENQLQKVLKIKSELPHLKKIIQYKGETKEKDVISWKDFMETGKKENDEALEKRLSLLAINHCCSLIYTSGTTGFPKGVMLSHDNLTYSGEKTVNEFCFKHGDSVVSYLPFSHIIAIMIDVICMTMVSGTTFFANPNALKGTFVKTLKEVKPTIFCGVPRVFEKIVELAKENTKQIDGIKLMIYNWAKSIGLEKNYRIQNNNFKLPFGHGLANSLVFSKMKSAIGFDECHFICSAGAPLSTETQQYLHSLDIPVIECYGLSETTGACTGSLSKCFKYGSVGKVLSDYSLKLINPDENGTGEICCNGRNIFMGYLNQKEMTVESFTKDEYFRTGDIGRSDDEFLYITSRIKELIITAGGENIPPILIENQIKKELPCISNAMLIGDKRKYLSVLLTLKTDIGPDMKPLDTFAPDCIIWLQSRNCNITKLSEFLAKKPQYILDSIQKGINKVNESAISKAQRVQKWIILPEDFSIAGDEIGPTMKLKRQVVLKKYADVIEGIYS